MLVCVPDQSNMMLQVIAFFFTKFGSVQYIQCKIMINVFWTPVVEYFMLLILWYFYLDTLLHKCTWLIGLDTFLMPETQISMAKK